MIKVDLLQFPAPSSQSEWKWGDSFTCQNSLVSLVDFLKTWKEHSAAEALLVTDANFSLPSEEVLSSLLSIPSIDLWHAGMRLGMAGKPEWIDFVRPTWMLNRDADPDIEFSSWRVSLRMMLVRKEFFHRFGLPSETFESLDAAGLDWGYRSMVQGGFLRYSPQLLKEMPTQYLLTPPQIPLKDQIRFIRRNFGKKWLYWACIRAWLTKKAGLFHLLKVLLENHEQGKLVERVIASSSRLSFNAQTSEKIPRVSVLIPTLQRYPYLKTVLQQLKTQTVPPYEVIVVDQTPKEERSTAFYQEFQDLPLRLFFLDEPGQCLSRNFGLLHARGEYVLFLDDDDEIPQDLVEKHLRTLLALKCDASCGIAHEIGAGQLHESFLRLRVSDVFPTNNTCLCVSSLSCTGLFDNAYNKGQNEDHDLGMRLYLSGAFMVLNPEIQVLHHHAPRGGLRAHGARVVTYALSRRSIWVRKLPSVSEIYLVKRYFRLHQVQEFLWMSFLGSFSVHGGWLQKIAKMIAGLLLLPVTVLEFRRRIRSANRLLAQFPQIPELR